jgi:hypothetical protein
MRRQHTEALARLGLKTEPYRIGDEPARAVGLAIVRADTGLTIGVTEQVPRGWLGDNKWYVWDKINERSRPGQVEECPDGRSRIRRIGRSFPTQRQAVAAIVRGALL